MTEAQTQSQLIKWWEVAHKGLGVGDKRSLIMIPNGSYLGGGDKVLKDGRKVPMRAIRMNQLKRQGFVRGAPDLFLAICRKHEYRLHHGGYEPRYFGGLWLEMKKEKGGVVSHSQTEMLSILSGSGYWVCVGAGFDEAVNHIVNYLGGQRFPGMA